MCNNDDKGLTQYSSSLYMNGVMEQFWGEQRPIWVWTRMAARPIPSWLTEPGMMREEVARRSEDIGVVVDGGITGEVDGKRPANGVPYIPSRLGS